jgi:hypothetical protein
VGIIEIIVKKHKFLIPMATYSRYFMGGRGILTLYSIGIGNFTYWTPKAEMNLYKDASVAELHHFCAVPAAQTPTLIKQASFGKTNES